MSKQTKKASLAAFPKNVNFEFAKQLFSNVQNADIAKLEEQYIELSNHVAAMSYDISKKDKKVLKSFIDSPSRIATYEVQHWKPLKKVVDFIESDETTLSQTLVDIISNFVGASKFVSVGAVLEEALPFNEMFEPIVIENSKWHSVVRSMGSLITLRRQEIENNMESTETNWHNELILNLRRLGYKIDENANLIK